jgi:hypothetical protein
MRYSVQAIESFRCKIASQDLKDKLKPREFVSFFNRTPDEALELWQLCSPNIMPKTSPKDMFWCLMYMKLYIPLDVIAMLLNISVPSLNKWVWIWVESIATLLMSFTGLNDFEMLQLMSGVTSQLTEQTSP